MASPQLRPKTRVLVPRDWSSESAALRLLSAERPEEIFPILLEEIVKLGFARALVLEVDFETGEIKPPASLNCDKAYLHRFRPSSTTNTMTCACRTWKGPFPACKP